MARPGGGGEWLVVVDGCEGPAYEAIGDGGCVFSPDGQLVAYAARQAGRWRVVCGEIEGEPFDWILPNGPRFSEDGDLHYLAVRDGRTVRVTHGA